MHYIKNYKTTISAIITAISLYVNMFHGDFAKYPLIVHIAQFVTLGGIASLGIVAKDSHSDEIVGAPKVVPINRPPQPPSDLPPAA